MIMHPLESKSIADGENKIYEMLVRDLLSQEKSLIASTHYIKHIC